MSQALLAMMGAGSPAAPTYVDDVFSAYTYTGNGSTQTITNGINLSTSGGMVWIKGRSNTGNNAIHDTVRGATNYLYADTTVAAATYADSVTAFNSNGFSLGVDGVGYWNTSPRTYVSWTFRKAARFFDVVTYTGNGANRTVSHSIGQVPGMIVVKRTDTTGSWMVYHNALANTENLALGTTAAKATNATAWNSTTSTSSVFSLGTHADVNTNAGTYVAYLFAHDTGADGLIQCGSFTTDGSGGATVNHGWSAGVQFALVKCSSTTGDWEMYDTARTSGWTGSDARLRANLSNAEDSVTRLSASGTSVTFAGLSNSATYIYMFIKAP